MRISRFEREETTLEPKEKENNICGVLVHADVARRERVHAALSACDGVEIHNTKPDGRFVVTVEDTDDAWASQIMTSFHKIDGVLSVALVYHHFESGNLEEEMSA